MCKLYDYNSIKKMNDKELKRISKFLSWVLRHHPEAIGIELDQQGWTAIDLLIEKSTLYGVSFDKETLLHIVATNAKKRFALNDACDKIRASQGHSVEIDLGYSNQQPPTVLYHGTGARSVASILNTGLEKRERQHVHLSRDVETAVAVGQRHGKPFVFKVLAGKMYADGFVFFLSDNGVWLTERVPVAYLEGMEEEH